MTESLALLNHRIAPAMPLRSQNAESSQELAEIILQLASLNMPCDSLSCITLNKTLGAVSCVARIVKRYIYRRSVHRTLEEFLKDILFAPYSALVAKDTQSSPFQPEIPHIPRSFWG